MVSLFRIDYRLIHWQTGVAWVQNLKINTIVIANDGVAVDPLRQGLMKAMGVNKNVEILFLKINDAISYLNSEESKERSIELLVDNSDDALAIAEEVKGISQINAAFMKIGPGRKMVNKSLAFGPHDIEVLKKIYEMGIEVLYYTVPNEKPVSVKKYFK
ncbi:MAG: PTS sugar transporter subunit IIB [Clostridium sp.]|nr:PTS sugar transporter subunit IIB [Clostridium sp.]